MWRNSKNFKFQVETHCKASLPLFTNFGGDNKMTSSLLFNVTTILFLVSTILFFVFITSRNSSIGLGASLTAFIGWGVETVAIILRWKESYAMGHGHAPLSNLYESVVFSPGRSS